MTTKITLLLAVLAMPLLSACVPVAIGATGVIVADQIAEDENGGDGLF